MSIQNHDSPASLASEDDDWHARYPGLRARIAAHFARNPDGHLIVGRKPSADAIKLSTSDYLDLGRDRRILAHQRSSLSEGDNDIFMSGAYVQYLDSQRGLEEKFAEYIGTSGSTICQSGFAANHGLIQAVANSETPVYIDMFAHASFWQGARTAQAPTFAFRHNDADHLSNLVEQHGPGVVAVDAIYSTLGDLCELEDIAALCDENDCLLIVDESHSIGACGPGGRGLVAELGLADKVPLRVFSLSKAFVGRGGVIAAPANFIEYYRYEAAPAIFSSAMLPYEIARFERTLDIVAAEDWRRMKLHAAAAQFRSGLLELGYDVSVSESQIIPLVAGPEARTRVLRDALESHGIFGSVFCAPATPRNKSMVRLCINAGLSGFEIEHAVDVFANIRDIVRPDQWPQTTVGRRGRKNGRVVPFGAGAASMT